MFMVEISRATIKTQERRRTMIKRTILKIFFVISLFSPLVVLAGGSFSNMYVFGDSLSDTGNLASITQPFPNPPFYMNRVSNGPVGVEILASSLGLTADASLHLIGPAVGTNYSVAGAHAAGDTAIDLPTQINLFLANNGGAAPADALYVVFIGGNDIRSARDEADEDQRKKIIKLAVHSIDIQLRTLIGAGARSIIVVNSPDIGGIPETQLIAAAIGDEEIPEETTELTKKFNKKLAKSIRKIEHQLGVDIVDFDVFSFFNSIRKNDEALGFTNSKNACFSQATSSFNPDCNFGARFGKFIFFDEIHPTERVHERTGRAIFAVVPVPVE